MERQQHIPLQPNETHDERVDRAIANILEDTHDTTADPDGDHHHTSDSYDSNDETDSETSDVEEERPLDENIVTSPESMDKTTTPESSRHSPRFHHPVVNVDSSWFVENLEAMAYFTFKEYPETRFDQTYSEFAKDYLIQAFFTLMAALVLFANALVPITTYYVSGRQLVSDVEVSFVLTERRVKMQRDSVASISGLGSGSGS